MRSPASGRKGEEGKTQRSGRLKGSGESGDAESPRSAESDPGFAGRWERSRCQLFGEAENQMQPDREREGGADVKTALGQEGEGRDGAWRRGCCSGRDGPGEGQGLSSEIPARDQWQWINCEQRDFAKGQGRCEGQWAGVRLELQQEVDTHARTAPASSHHPSGIAREERRREREK